MQRSSEQIEGQDGAKTTRSLPAAPSLHALVAGDEFTGLLLRGHGR